MKFQVSSAGLLKALMDIFKAVPVKSPTPILENFLFCLKDSKLVLTASDSELTLRTTIEVTSCDEEGECLDYEQEENVLKTQYKTNAK